nr:rhomboid family intramembrane serine protease [uncultured Acetatifactor sp.]
MLQKWKSWPVVSAALVLTNVIIFIICTFTGDLLYNKGILDVWHVAVKREYGRIIWAMFLHSGVSHIFNNMFILFFLGAMIEKEIGHIRYGVLYFLSGIGGNLASLFFKLVTDDISGSIGASGAVFGLDGVLLAMVLLFHRPMKNVTPVRVMLMIFYSLYSGFTGSNIDNAAHIGGLATGFVCGSLMCLLWKGNKRRS